MNYKFNVFERSVGIFVGVTIVGSFILGLGVAIKKNWFEDKTTFHTYLKNADNIRTGTLVQISGLRVGEVESVELDSEQHVKVTFSILEKYAGSMTEGSKVELFRPFLIGEKIINLSVGPKENKKLIAGSMIHHSAHFDALDFLSGDQLVPYIGKIDNILTNLNDTLISSKSLTSQLAHKDNLQKTLQNLTITTHYLKQTLPHIVGKAPQMSEDVSKVMQNLVTLTDGLKELQPVMKQLAQTLPQGSERAIQALNESITVLKAMQKSFFLSGAVKEVKEEEKKRMPASEDKAEQTPQE